VFEEGPKKAPRHEDFPPLPEGEAVRQKNEGEYDFILAESDDGKAIVLEVKVGKFLDTSLIKVRALLLS
jgi:protein TilB